MTRTSNFSRRFPGTDSERKKKIERQLCGEGRKDAEKAVGRMVGLVGRRHGAYKSQLETPSEEEGSIHRSKRAEGGDPVAFGFLRGDR